MRDLRWRLIDTFTVTSTAFTEYITALTTVMYGGWLLLPFNTFALSSYFDIIKLVAPETVWGLCFVAVGVTKLVFWLRGSPTLRLVGMAASLALWIWFLLLGAQGNWAASINILISIEHIGSIGWCFVRLSGVIQRPLLNEYLLEDRADGS